MKTSSVEWRALECVKRGQMSRIYPSPVSGLTDFPRMCRRRSASIPVVAYVVDIGPRYRSLIIPRFSFFTRVPSCIQNDSIRGCSTGRLIGKIIARGKRRGIISEGYIRKLYYYIKMISFIPQRLYRWNTFESTRNRRVHILLFEIERVTRTYRERK